MRWSSPAGDTSILHSHSNWLHTFPVENMDQGLSLGVGVDAIHFLFEEKRECTPSHASSCLQATSCLSSSEQ